MREQKNPVSLGQGIGSAAGPIVLGPNAESDTPRSQALATPSFGAYEDSSGPSRRFARAWAPNTPSSWQEYAGHACSDVGARNIHARRPLFCAPGTLYLVPQADLGDADGTYTRDGEELDGPQVQELCPWTGLASSPNCGPFG